MKDVLESLVDEMVEKGILWKEARSQLEKLFLQKALCKAGGRVGEAAEIMGVHRNTVSKKIRAHRISRK